MYGIVEVLKMSKRLRHRGPGWSGIFTSENAILAHERLAIVGPIVGNQPLSSADGRIALVVSGEIYNHRELAIRCRSTNLPPSRIRRLF